MIAVPPVVINEVAWMGSADSANHEWIELANTGTTAVDLSNWKLASTKGINSTLKGQIEAGGFFLLERTSDQSVPNIKADQIYTGALSNTGTTLALKNSDGTTVDEVRATAGWPAGDKTTKATMQRTTQGAWITARATPRAANTVIASPIPKTVAHAGGQKIAVPIKVEPAHPPSPEITNISVASATPQTTVPAAVIVIDQPVGFFSRVTSFFSRGGRWIVNMFK